MQNQQFKAVIFDGGGIFSMTADTGSDRYWEGKLGLLEGGLKQLGITAIHYTNKGRDILEIERLLGL